MNWLLLLLAIVTINFDDMEAGKPPKGFSFGRTGKGAEGTWVVRDAADGKGKALAQTSDDSTDLRFPVAVVDSTNQKDLTVSVRFHPVSGKVDQAGGIVFRYADADNYYLVRANALEDNVRIYYVQNGTRKQFSGKNVKVESGKWHTLKVTAQGNKFLVWFDGESVIEATDDAFKNAGKAGLWTKADSVTEFDDLVIEPIAPKD